MKYRILLKTATVLALLALSACSENEATPEATVAATDVPAVVEQPTDVPTEVPTAVPTTVPTVEPTAELTKRELRVLSILAQGKPNREIAAALVVSEKTVRNSVSIILSKLAVAKSLSLSLSIPGRKPGLVPVIATQFRCSSGGFFRVANILERFWDQGGC